jgi:hypothetical protein
MSDKLWRSIGIIAALALVGGAWGPMISAGTHRWPFALQFRLGFMAAGLIAAVCLVWRNDLLGAAIGVGTGAVAAMMMGHTWLTLRGADLGNFAQPGWGFSLLVTAGAVFLILLVHTLRTAEKTPGVVDPSAI